MQKIAIFLSLALMLTFGNIAVAEDDDLTSIYIDTQSLIGTYVGDVPFVYPEGFATHGVQIELLEIQDRRIRGIISIIDESGNEFSTGDFSAILLPGLRIRGASNLLMLEGIVQVMNGVPTIMATLLSTASRYDEFPPVPEVTELFPAAGYLTASKTY
jgi:hypothetical protein